MYTVIYFLKIVGYINPYIIGGLAHVYTLDQVNLDISNLVYVLLVHERLLSPGTGMSLTAIVICVVSDAKATLITTEPEATPVSVAEVFPCISVTTPEGAKVALEPPLTIDQVIAWPGRGTPASVNVTVNVAVEPTVTEEGELVRVIM